MQQTSGDLVASVIAQSYLSWYQPDALYAWSPIGNTNTSQVSPNVGSAMPKLSTNPATSLAGSWDMTGSAYGGSTEMTANLDTTLPFGICIGMDTNTQTNKYTTVVRFGGASFIDFYTDNFDPVFQYALNSGAFYMGPQCASTFTPPGTMSFYWTYCNPSDPTHTISSGINQTTTTQTGVLSVPTNGMTRNLSFGSSGGSTGQSNFKQSLTQIVGNRSGSNAWTLPQFKQNVVAKMQARFAQG